MPVDLIVEIDLKNDEDHKDHMQTQELDIHNSKNVWILRFFNQ